jgi:PPOX class probable F420-dependent enzyme
MRAHRELDSGIARYLQSHRVGVLATLRKNGPPQQTLVAYHFDGTDFAISVRGFSVKAKNLRRRPEASLAVIDGTTQFIATGRVQIVEDEAEVLRLNLERLKLISTRNETDEEMARRLREEQRVVLLLTPDRFYPPNLT